VPFSYVLQLLLVFVTYFFTGRFGLTFGPVGGFATLFWLPTGISLAAILFGGYRLWPAIFIGAFLVNLTSHASLPVAATIGIGNTLEALFAAFLLTRFLHFHNSLVRVRDLLVLTLVAGPLSALISATIGTEALYLGHTISYQNIFSTWLAWVVGDILSNIIVTPFLLSWSIRFSLSKLTFQRIFEAVTVTILLATSYLLIFTDIWGIHGKIAPITYLIFPPLIWIALRFGQRTTATTIMLLSCISVWSTRLGLGPFVKSSISESLLYLQTFMGTVAITSLILAGVVHESNELEKRKDEFISIASHELKTPLTTITLLLQLLKRLQKKKKEIQSLELINKTESQVKKMADLITDLLDLSKIQIGKLELRKERFAMYELVQEVVDNIQRITKKHTIIIEEQTKKKVVADKERISQVLINLLNNAIRYSPKADKIIVSLKATSQDFIVSVEDFGIGIARKDQEKIFERFFRVKDSDNKNYTGFGIGLYIANAIVRKHHGRIWVQSSKGKGTTFSFSLPLSNRIRRKILPLK